MVKAADSCLAEVPIITVTANTFGVIFKPFGVRLDFIPTIPYRTESSSGVSEVSDIAAGSSASVPVLSCVAP